MPIDARTNLPTPLSPLRKGSSISCSYLSVFGTRTGRYVGIQSDEFDVAQAIPAMHSHAAR